MQFVSPFCINLMQDVGKCELVVKVSSFLSFVLAGLPSLPSFMFPKEVVIGGSSTAGRKARLSLCTHPISRMVGLAGCLAVCPGGRSIQEGSTILQQEEEEGFFAEVKNSLAKQKKKEKEKCCPPECIFFLVLMGKIHLAISQFFLKGKNTFFHGEKDVSSVEISSASRQL